MGGNWAFNWVQIVAHNKKGLALVWGFVSLILLWGVTNLDFSPLLAELGLLGGSLIVMTALVAYLTDSVKTALLQFGLSLYILLMSFGGLGWSGHHLTPDSILGLVVLFTLMTSNLIHVMTTLLREMARGLFQYDAIAEALKLNAVPILLSNITTALGFVFAAWFDSSLQDLAWIVVVGVLVSYWVTLSWLPLILLSWLLEFRVGNTADRHGFSNLAQWLAGHPNSRAALLGLSAVLGFFLLGYAFFKLTLFAETFWLLISFFIIFWFFWRSLKLAALNVLVNLLALLATIAVFMLLTGAQSISLIMLMIPMGLIVDDGVHFFSRYVRAQQGFFRDSDSAVRFAMASVGRPIWMTSWIVLCGLSVLLFSQSVLVVQSSLITLFALVISTVLILLVVPAMLMTRKN